MSWRGDRIMFDNVIAMFAAQGEELVRQWENHVSLGLHQDFLISPMDNVSDDLSNKSAGYSFLSDRRNSYHRHSATVLTSVISDRTLSDRFINGFDFVTGKPMWNPVAIQAYLKQVQVFSGLLLTRCEMVSGAPIRGTELTSMTFRNTATRRRNLVMFGKYMLLLGMYSKTTSGTGNDRLIAHAVDALTKALLTDFLTFIRPFVQVLVSQCFSAHTYPGLHDMYDSFLFVDYDALFTTERLSAMMRENTRVHLDVPLPISEWRHVSIGFQKVHCRRELHAVNHVDEGERIAAEQAGHSHGIESRMYALSSDGIQGTPGHELHLFCNVSVTYQTATRVVPAGVELSYRGCMPDKFEQLVAQGVIAPLGSASPEQVIANRVVELLKPYISQLMAPVPSE